MTSAATLTVPVALFLLSVWWLTTRHALTRAGSLLYFLGTLAVAGATAAGHTATVPVAAAGIVIAVVATETLASTQDR